MYIQFICQLCSLDNVQFFDEQGKSNPPIPPATLKLHWLGVCNILREHSTSVGESLASQVPQMAIHYTDYFPHHQITNFFLYLFNPHEPHNQAFIYPRLLNTEVWVFADALKIAKDIPILKVEVSNNPLHFRATYILLIKKKSY